jgi:division protein CdvB (Snf7/Vps24/ESCRT-III family)
MIQRKKDQATYGLSRVNSGLASSLSRVKNAVVSALDSAISSLRKLITKAKTVASQKLPSIAKIKSYLSTAKEKITSIRSVADLKETLSLAYEKAKQKVSTIQRNGFKSFLEPLRKRMDRIFNRRAETKQVRPESKVW